MESTTKAKKTKPDWLKIRLPNDPTFFEVQNRVKNHELHTICQSGKCPNIGECWSRGTATFMILGDICTRACRFCAVKTGRPDAVDWEEPARVAESIRLMQLKHCVITSVDRDDLPDGGASFWAKTIESVKEANPNTTIEVLIPDFKGKEENVLEVVKAKPNVISHNMETVRRLTRQVRRNSDYDRSLSVLKMVANAGVRAKSGIMLGIGETQEEVLETMDDLRNQGVEVMTIGQYLQPTKEHLEVQEFIKPEIFEFYKKEGLAKGFRHVESGALVRSSYYAEKHVQ